MKIHLFVVALASGCWTGSSPPAAPVTNTSPEPARPKPAPEPELTQVEKALEAMEGFTQDICRCTDAACANSVMERYTKWGEQMAKEFSGRRDEKPDEAMTKRMVDTATKFAECMTMAMQNGSTP